jgi:hypothetical protein
MVFMDSKVFFNIKPKTRQELANEFGICEKTFNKYLKAAKIKLPSGLVFLKDQERIYKKLGLRRKI